MYPNITKGVLQTFATRPLVQIHAVSVGSGSYNAFKAIDVAVAPVVVAAFLTIKSDPEVARTAALPNRDNAAPVPEAAVVKVEFGVEYTVFAVDAVVGALIESVAVHEQPLALYSNEAAAGLISGVAAADISVAGKRIIGGKEGVAVGLSDRINAADGHIPLVFLFVVVKVRILIPLETHKVLITVAIGGGVHNGYIHHIDAKSGIARKGTTGQLPLVFKGGYPHVPLLCAAVKQQRGSQIIAPDAVAAIKEYSAGQLQP